jgi:hypothetical protein
MNQIYKYVYDTMNFELQPHSQTNIIREVGLWYVDFMHKYCLKNCDDWYLQYDIISFEKIFYKKDIFTGDIFMFCILTNINILEIYKIFAMIQTQNIDILDDYINNNNWYFESSCSIGSTNTYLRLFIQLCDIVDYIVINDFIRSQLKSRIIFIVMTSILNIFEKGVNPIIKNNGFKKMCSQKAIDMIAEADIVTPISFQIKFKNLFTKMSEIIK